MGPAGTRPSRSPSGRSNASETQRLCRMDGIMKTSRTILASLLLLFWIQPGTAQSIVFKQYTLKNGLRVILSEDHSAPTYSVAVTYNAGSRDERKGKTGFAHLFEHMMFQGSENVGKGEHMIIVENNGGEANGNTTDDRTEYDRTQTILRTPQNHFRSIGGCG